MPTMDDDEKLIAALRSYKQADADGVMCVVSRQAVHEAADRLSALKAERDRMAAALRPFADAARETVSEYEADGEDIWEHGAAQLITMKHLRAARAALSQEPTQ